MEQELLRRYKDIMDKRGNKPDWAVHRVDKDGNRTNELIPCTIPFVGKYYAEQPVKVLVYASAENLRTYKGGVPLLGDDVNGNKIDGIEIPKEAKNVYNRHRAAFDYWDDWNKLGNGTSERFFPYVHLGPMETGCLATAAYYIMQRLYAHHGMDFDKSMQPREFLETIAFANFGKYSIETEAQINGNSEGSKKT